MKLVRVPLRISFAGGGSDIPSHYEQHEGAICSITINKYIYITAKPNLSLFPHRYRLVYSQVEECNDREEIKHPIIKQLVKDYAIPALDLDVMSDIPAGTGMGSSSAFTVGLHKALGEYDQPTKFYMAELACQTELTDLKEPIGKQDQYAASFGGLNYIHFTKEGVTVAPILLPESKLKQLKQCLHLIYIGGNRSASKLLKEQNTNDFMTIHNIALLAQEAASCLRRGQIEDLGPIIKDGWEHKKSLSAGISNEYVDTIIDTALKHGATGGKLLGAGGAGFVLLFCPLKNKYEMFNGLREHKLEFVDFEFDMEGCKVLYEA